MDVRPAGEASSIVVALREPEQRLASLRESPLAARFCAWHGASGRRYVTTVFAVDSADPQGGLPAYESFVLIAVGAGQGGAGGRRVLAVTPVERATDLRGALASGLAMGACEWHVHFLAEDRRARAATIGDLRARHCGAMAACA